MNAAIWAVTRSSNVRWRAGSSTSNRQVCREMNTPDSAVTSLLNVH